MDGFRAVRLGIRWFGIGCLAGWLVWEFASMLGWMACDAFCGDYCT